MLFPRKYASCPWPDSRYRTYMNGRLKKVDMESRLLNIKKGIDDKTWYPDWDSKERWAAQLALNNALDVLDEYDYWINIYKDIFLMNKFSRIFHHIDIKDVKQKRLEEFAIEKLKEEKRLWKEEKKLKEERILTRIVDKKKSNWKNELSESDWSSVSSSIANRATQTFQHISGTTATFAGLGGVEVHPSTTVITGETVSTPTYSDLALAGYAKPLGMGRRDDYEDVNPKLDASQEFTQNVNVDVMMNARVNPELSYPTDIQKVYGYGGLGNFGPAPVNDGLTDNQLNSKWIEQKQIQDDHNKKVTKLQSLMTHDNQDKIQKQLDDLESEYFKNMVDHWNNWESLAQQGRGQKDPEPVTPKVTKDDEGFLNKVASTMQVGTAKRVFDYHMNFIKNPTNKPQDVTNLISSKDMKALTKWANSYNYNARLPEVEKNLQNHNLNVVAKRTPGLKHTLGNLDLDRGDGITKITPEYIEIRKAYDFDGLDDIGGAGPLTGVAAAVYGGSRMGVKGMFQGTPTMYIIIRIPRKKRETK